VTVSVRQRRASGRIISILIFSLASFINVLEAAAARFIAVGLAHHAPCFFPQSVAHSHPLPSALISRYGSKRASVRSRLSEHFYNLG
jgi:hypothetical protein